MEDRAKKLANNALLVLAARLMSIVGVPLGMAVLAWLITGQIAQDKAGALQSLRIEALERANARQDETLTEVKRQRELDITVTRDVQESTARIVEKLDAITRSMSRVEGYIDRQTDPVHRSQ